MGKSSLVYRKQEEQSAANNRVKKNPKNNKKKTQYRSFTRKICWLKIWISSKLDWVSASLTRGYLLLSVIAYTSKNPSPVRMYCSLIALYSSWPAVSRMSRRATSSSMTHCFRYESSMVGSYSSTKWDYHVKTESNKTTNLNELNCERWFANTTAAYNH